MISLVAQSRSRCFENERLLAESRVLIATSRRILNPAWAIEGSSEDDLPPAHERYDSSVSSKSAAVERITAEELLTDLGVTQTDLVRVVEAVVRDRLPFVVVAAQAVRAWERREPETWAKVMRWLVARGVAVVAV